MHPDFPNIILQATGARAIRPIETIQELWSGYGTIRRFGLTGADRASVVVKHVRFPGQVRHPRGWNSDLSHRRKLRSYEVERAWYARWGGRCAEGCRIPACLALESRGEETLMVLEDLDAAGFPGRRERVGEAEMRACLHWLANFHATFLGDEPEGLWQEGTYWHLATRPDELAALDDPGLKAAAPLLDRLLKECRFRSLVHGDAKLANFCFSEDGSRVAAVDFQYVGGGCGMKDVAYFIGSCLDEEGCALHEAWLLETYFAALRRALTNLKPAVDATAVEAEWRALFPLAWTDFHRFLKGWCPGHWKVNDYSERLARSVVEGLKQGRVAGGIREIGKGGAP